MAIITATTKKTQQNIHMGVALLQFRQNYLLLPQPTTRWRWHGLTLFFFSVRGL